MVRDWLAEPTPGDCPECGAQCAPDCGLHPKGCFFGGMTEATGYWTFIEDCELFHG
jgi:hypothetical protein